MFVIFYAGVIFQASLPHVMHCCAAVLSARKQNNPDAKFDSNETKLLYTVHFIILDAASECEDMDNERVGGRNFSQPSHNYMFSMETIQLFVYLFAPIIESLKESEFQTLKLENGLRLWQPLWGYHQPDVPCCSTFVKSTRDILKAERRHMIVNFNAGNIYIGKGTSNDNIYLGFDDVPGSRSSYYDSASPHAPLARMSDICALSTTETQSTSIEIVCEVCNQTMQNRNGELSCKCGVRRSSYVSFLDPKLQQQKSLGSPVDKDYVAKRLESAIASGMGIRCSEPMQDLLSASYFDVAVLRCLFSPQWAEPGIYWALRYTHQRLLEVCDDMHRVEDCRERSNSLPTTLPSSTVNPSPPTPPSPRREDLLSTHDHRRDSAAKRMKVTELKQIFDDKVRKLRRRESCDQFELDSHSANSDSGSGRTSPDFLSSSDHPPPRPNSALAKLNENEEDTSAEDDRESGDSSLDVGRRRSMPTLQQRNRPAPDVDEEDDLATGTNSGIGKDGVSRETSFKQELLPKPIITITEDSPDPTPSPSWVSKRESLASNPSDRSESASQRTMSQQRSLSDSNIAYHQQDEVRSNVKYLLCYIKADWSVVVRPSHDHQMYVIFFLLCGISFTQLCNIRLDIL